MNFLVSYSSWEAQGRTWKRRHADEIRILLFFFFRDFYISKIPTLLGHRYLLFLQKNIGILNLIIRYLNEGSVVYIIVEER